jgi:hypothetical protein
MKKNIVLFLAIVALVGCGGTENLVEEEYNNALVDNCIIGEVYSPEELSFDICSSNTVTVGSVSDNLQPINMDGQIVGHLVVGNFENDMVKVELDELKLSLENGLFGGVVSVDEEGYGANYIDVDGWQVLELEFLGANQGLKNYFVLVEENLLKFDDNFKAVAFLTGVQSR